VVLAFSEQNRRAPLLERTDHVIKNELVAPRVGGKRGVQILDARRPFARSLEPGLSDHERTSEGTLCRLALRIHNKADRPELHCGDRMVPIAPLWSGGQPDDVARLYLGEYALK
jgi:hypothetical protein